MKKIQAPPVFAQDILSALSSKRDREIILGEFSEEHAKLQKSSKISSANFWYWKELLISAPILISVKIRLSLFRRQSMKIFRLIQPGKKSALWSLFFLLPAALLAYLA